MGEELAVDREPKPKVCQTWGQGRFALRGVGAEGVADHLHQKLVHLFRRCSNLGGTKMDMLRNHHIKLLFVIPYLLYNSSSIQLKS